MAYRYSLRDDNDPLLSLLDQPGSDNAPSLSQPVAAAPPPPDDSGSLYGKPINDDALTSLLETHHVQPNPQQQQKKQLDDAWTAREQQALADSQPKSYGLGEGLRDNAGAVIASILDIGFNKGRGLGNIVQASAGEVGRQQAERDLKQKQAGDFALAIRGKKGDELAQQRLQYAYDSLRAREGAAGGVQSRHDEDVKRKDDPNSQHNATAEEMRFKLGKAGKQGSEEAAHEYAPTEAGDKALATTATTNAATAALAGNPRAITAQEATNNARADKQLAISEDLRTQGMNNAERSKFENSMKDVLDVASKARELKDIFAKTNGEDLPGLGPLDANTPSWLPQGLGGPTDEDLNVRNLVAQFKNPGVHARSGAAVNPSERPSLDAEFGRIGDERTTKTAIDNVYNTMISKIRAAAVGKEDLVRDILTARGLGDVLPAQDPAAAAMPQPQPGAVDPLAGAQDFVPLGVPQRKPAALAPSAPGALGPPQAVNADDWKARYEKFKIGAPQ